MLVKTATLPGPPDLFPRFGTFNFVRDPLGTLMRDTARYGGFYRNRVGPTHFYAVNDPDYARVVLHERSKGFVKSRQYDVLKRLLGNGLVTSDGDEWRRQRRVVMPAMRKNLVDNFASAMVAQAEAALQRWEGRETIDAGPEMVKIALYVVGATVLSTSLDLASTELGRAFYSTVAHVGEMQRNPLLPPLWVPTPANVRFNRGRALIEAFVLDLIRERRHLTSPPEDLLTLMMHAKDEETGVALDDRQLVAQVLTFFLVAFETTATTLSWMWWAIGTHPQVESRLLQELDENLGSRAPTASDMRRLPYLSQVMKEVLRLFPPAWALGRSPLRDERIGPYVVPAGAAVLISPYVIHRLPSLWPDPERFDPERFLPEAEQARHPYAYIPFGGGPRTCIGDHFAALEVVAVVSMIARAYRLEPIAPERVAAEAAAVLRLKGGSLPMRLVKREPTRQRLACKPQV